MAGKKLDRTILLFGLEHLSGQILSEVSAEKEKSLRAVELKEMFIEYLNSRERAEVSRILQSIPSPKHVILTAYSLSDPSYLSLLKLDKKGVEEIVDFVIGGTMHLGNPSISVYFGFPKDEEEDKKQEHYISPSDLWRYVNLHLGSNLITLLEENRSYLHLLRLLVQDYVYLEFRDDEFVSIIESIFSHQTLRQLRIDFELYGIKNAYEIVEHLSSIFVRAGSLIDFGQLRALVKEGYRDYSALIALQYRCLASWSVLKALDILNKMFDQKVQLEFIEAYSFYSQMLGFKGRLSYLPQGTKNTTTQIRQLKFLKAKLPLVYGFILQNTKYSDFTNTMIGRSGYNCRREFWLFCHDDAWIKETKLFVMSKFRKLLEDEEQARFYSLDFFELALLCKYVDGEKQVLVKYIKEALDERNREIAKSKLTHEKIVREEKEELHNAKGKLQKLRDIDDRKVLLHYRHKERIEELEKKIERSEELQDRRAWWNVRIKDELIDGYEKEAHDYLKKWLKEQKF